MSNLINIRPSGVNWEDKELIMDLKCFYKDRKAKRIDKNDPRIKNAIIVAEHSHHAVGMEFTVLNDYVSIVHYQLYTDIKADSNYATYHNETSFIFFSDEFAVWKVVSTNWNYDHLKQIVKNHPHIKSEVRIYKDKKLAVVYNINNKFYVLKDLQAVRGEFKMENFIEVHNDDEIKANSIRVTKAHSTLELACLGVPVYPQMHISDNYTGRFSVLDNEEARGNILDEDASYSYNHCTDFGSKIGEKLKDFFGTTNSICNFNHLLNVLVSHPVCSQTNPITQLKIEFPETTDNHPADISVRREGDYIIFAQPDVPDVGFCHGGVAVFDVKNKVCFKKNIQVLDKPWSAYNTSNDYDLFDKYDSGVAGIKESCILYKGDMKDIFKDTIIEYLLTANTDNIMLPSINTSLNEVLHNNSVKNANYLLSMLVSGKYQFYEQLAKCQMFNLFTWFIDKKIGREPIKDFWLSCYNEKGTSVKEALGLNMKQLRALDEYLKAERTGDNIWKRNRVYLKFLEIGLGIKIDNQIDPNTFQNLLSIFKGMNSWFTSYTYRDCDALKAFLAKLSLKDKVTYLIKYLSPLSYSKIETVNDYLSMRAKAKEVGEDSSHYPTSPAAEEKHIAYHLGMRLRGRAIDSEDDFEHNIKEYYGADPKKVKIIKNDLGTMSIIQMTPYDHLSLLHDDLSVLMELKQDEHRRDAFNKAMKRVKDLEFEDKETGLCLVAPKDIQDIKNEAHDLEHCLASYIDPICDGLENIMFIRRNDMKNISYFTLEIVDPEVITKIRNARWGEEVDANIKVGEVRQIHGFRNNNPTESSILETYERTKKAVYNKPYDIIKFLLKWAKAMKGKIDTKSIKNQYGALCAQHK